MANTDRISSLAGSPRETVRHRGNKARKMLAFFEASGVKALQEVRRDHVDAWLAYLGGEYRTAKDTPITTMHLLQHHLCTKDFFGWLEREGRILTSPYGVRDRPERPDAPTRPPEVFTPEEAVKLLEAVDPRTTLGLRDRAVLELLYSTGMRKGELVALDVADFAFKRQELAILKSKNKRGRVGAGRRVCPALHRGLHKDSPAPGSPGKRRKLSSSATTAGIAWPCGPSRRSWRGRSSEAGWRSG